MSDDAPIDLRTLDPTLDTERFEASMQRLRFAAAPALRARRGQRRAIEEIGGWWRPALAAAAVIATIALGDLLRTPPADAAAGTTLASAGASWADVAGVPSQFSGYLERNQAPSGEQLLELAGGIR